MELKNALVVPPHRPHPDFTAAATKIGVTEAKLKEALGVPPHPPKD